ncbi:MULTISPECIES: N-acetyltransferase family protein [unclassified Marinovum]
MNLYIRAARSTDAGKIAAILTEGNAAPPWKPHLHTGAQDVAFCGKLIDRGWVRIAENEEGRIVGFIARDGEEIDALYVAGPDRGHGIGTVLLNDAKSACKHLELWTFQLNTGAQKFYEREGFTEIKRTDGSTNQEQLPDVRYAWDKEPPKAAPAKPAAAQPEPRKPEPLKLEPTNSVPSQPVKDGAAPGGKAPAQGGAGEAKT